MSKNSSSKPAIIKAAQFHQTDTGSAVVQIALLSARIEQLSAHLKVHRKDIPSRRSLLKMVARRKKFQKQLGQPKA